MWSISLRDLQFRRRRFAITIAGTALVFAMALVMSGMSNGFREEVRGTVDSIGADAWVVSAGVTGPFASLATIPAATARQVRADPRVRAAVPIVSFRRDFHHDGELRPAYLMGYPLGGFVEAPVVEGEPPRTADQAAVDRRMGLAVGTRVEIAGHAFRIVGLTEGRSVFTGVPDVYVALSRAQAMAFEGQPVATAVVTRGVPREVPSGVKLLTNEEVREDLLRPMENGISSIDQVQLLLWAVATMIIGAVVYLSALERARDFAVLKAVGATGRDLFVSLAFQAVVVALVAAVVAIGLGQLLAPLFPMPVEIPGTAVAALPGVAAVVGVVASLAGVRRAVSVDPATAFGGP